MIAPLAMSDNSKLPSMSVMVPLVVPLRMTFTPASGVPVWSFTLPPDSESGFVRWQVPTVGAHFSFFMIICLPFYSVGESVCGENFFYDFVHGFWPRSLR